MIDHKQNKPSSANKMLILIILGTFTLVELLYIPDEYRWAFDKAYSLLVCIFK